MGRSNNKGASWSMKHDRELIELSKSSQNLEAVAKHFGRHPDKILKSATRLGLTQRREPLRLKAEGR
jgi:hypothetical protein